MRNQIITKEFLSAMLKSLTKDYRVVAPVRNGKVLEFMGISGDTEIVMNDEIPYKSAKDCFFPQVEKLLTFKDGEVAANINAEKTIIFGMKPCDAEALRVLREVFLAGQYQDPFFQSHFENTLIIAVGCVREKPGCFCAERGIDKSFTDFCDILLNDEGGEEYTVVYLSEKGMDLLGRFEETKHILPPPERKAAETAPEVKKVELNQELDETAYFDIIDWGKATEICQGCGICTFICPTCHCFDLKDVSMQGATDRFRCWDSCMYPKFTLHASGHNPRASTKERYRQRVLHKYLYVPQNFGCTACTGCGRCIRSCPAGMSIRKVVEEVMEVQP
ncbi:MAG: 4Fe-4S dicluster domain-containing protein [Clostridiales bacterium]|nr:4Fe-4S dicluster domain-containing protein [Clostridiales bacterium]